MSDIEFDPDDQLDPTPEIEMPDDDDDLVDDGLLWDNPLTPDAEPHVDDHFSTTTEDQDLSGTSDWWQAHDESQDFAISYLEGVEVGLSSEELEQLAGELGLAVPGAGTPEYSSGALLQAFGVPVERVEQAGLVDLQERVAQGDRVAVSLDTEQVWRMAQPALLEARLDQYPGIPGQGDLRTVEVLSFSGEQIVLRAPGGTVNTDTGSFDQAWAASNQTLTTVPPHRAGTDLRFSGYPDRMRLSLSAYWPFIKDTEDAGADGSTSQHTEQGNDQPYETVNSEFAPEPPISPTHSTRGRGGVADTPPKRG